MQNFHGNAASNANFDPLYSQSNVFLRVPSQANHHLCEWMENGQMCGFSFAKMSDFINHLNLDHVNNPTNDESACSWSGCSRQDKPFKAKYKLVNHLRIHTGEKPFVCDEIISGIPCGKRFARSENLKIHRRIHTGERPFDCYHPGCKKTFSNSSDRKKHMNVHKKGVLKCPVDDCEREYCHPSSLRKHMKAHHGDAAPVPIPSRSIVGEKRARDEDQDVTNSKRQKSELDCSVGSPNTNSSSSEDEGSSHLTGASNSNAFADNIYAHFAQNSTTENYAHMFPSYFNTYYESLAQTSNIPMYNYSLNL
ncbi:Oidioi.mRNA.OKI2018_I69.chr2.g3988.t1.cds [Oikopleura dioica]|uniref:Oidioi.mRNA.OKI2018_I69.chr2.g3988.t1.cds n=1 Tax=Oikopleura dioica TaxID=34765 RepID=A0ABN7SZF0_OIKDI|nr:Oidioi.mRNA.OKI2018_I69.chr2.g3988.t1.cds [Oikopleura dioica]